jgi:hypothetical protein
MKPYGHTENSRRQIIAYGVLVLAIAGILLSYNLSLWPVTWYDEGMTLQVSRNLVESGRYGILSSDGFRAHSPTITTGPTVSGPIALIFAVTSAGLVQARVVMVGYALLSVLCRYLLALRLFDIRTALLGSLLLISVGAASGEQSASFLGLGRMAMGEVPALALLLAGTLLWSISLANDRLIPLIGAGLLWGLAVVTKTQSVLIVAGLLLTWVVYALARRKPKARYFGVPLVAVLACAGFWLVFAYYTGGAAPQAGVASRIGTQLPILRPGLVLKSLRIVLGVASPGLRPIHRSDIPPCRPGIACVVPHLYLPDLDVVVRPGFSGLGTLCLHPSRDHEPIHRQIACRPSGALEVAVRLDVAGYGIRIGASHTSTKCRRSDSRGPNDRRPSPSTRKRHRHAKR